MSDIWCPLPWSHFGVKSNGSLRMCSHSQSAGSGNTLLKNGNQALTIEDLDTVDILNCDTLKGVRKNFKDSTWPPQCRRCEIDYISGSNSRNLWEAKNHSSLICHQAALADTNIDGSIKGLKLFTLDLRMGNTCNLRCTMCYPGESSKWHKDYEQITGENSYMVDDTKYSINDGLNAFDWPKSKWNLENLVKNSNHLKKIKFGGGEPTIIKECEQLIVALIASGNSSEISLEYSCNMTMIPNQLWEYWKNFKEVRLCCSIDAVGEANEAIRFPTKWEDVYKNLRLIEKSPNNIKAFTSTTISLLSLEHYSDFLIWSEENNFIKVNDSINLGAAHLVYNPNYLNICLLSDEDFNEIYSKLLSKITQHKINENKLKSKLEYIKRLKQSLIVSNKEACRKQFSDRFFRFQELQNQDWSKIFPFAYKIALSWQ